MTYEEAKNEIAKRRGWSGWPEALVIGTEDDLLIMSNHAAQLFGDSQVNAALDKAIEAVENRGTWSELLEELKRLKR